MNGDHSTLAGLRVGEEAVVTALQATASMRRRFLDMGLTENTVVRCLYRSPSGDPTAYAVRGTVLALRRRDAAAVAVRRKVVGE